MGHESAVEYVAAVTIQRWFRRRYEVTCAIRLLAILRLLQDESKGKKFIMPFLQPLSSPMDGDGRIVDDVEQRAVKLLLALAVKYAERLHDENYTRRLTCSSSGGKYEAQFQDAEEKSKRTKICHHNAFRRLLLLPDEVLEELLLDVSSNSQQHQQRQEQLLGSIACNLQKLLDASCTTCLSRHVCGPPDEKDVDVTVMRITRPMWWSLRRMLVRTNATMNFTGTTLDDVPPLPKPPVVRKGVSLSAETETAAAPACTHTKRTKDAAVGNSDSDGHEDSDSDNSDDDYSDEKYYSRQREWELARVARIRSLLEINDTPNSTSGKNTAGDEAAAAAERESYMKMFGDVKDVLFPTLNAMKTMSTKRDAGDTADKNTSNASRCCIVCELHDELETLVKCHCGSWVHLECAMNVADDVPRCSEFCNE